MALTRDTACINSVGIVIKRTSLLWLSTLDGLLLFDVRLMYYGTGCRKEMSKSSILSVCWRCTCAYSGFVGPSTTSPNECSQGRHLEVIGELFPLNVQEKYK